MSLAAFTTFLIYCLYIDVATCTAGAQYFEHVSKPHSKQQHKDQKCLLKDHVASDSNHKYDSTTSDVKTENDSCQNSKLFAKLASELEYSSLNQIFTKNKVVTFRIEGVDHKIMHLFHRENLWIYLYRLGMNTYIIKRSYKYQDNYSEVDFYKNKIKHENIVQSFGAFYIASCRGCYFVFMEYLPIELSFADITIETILQIGLDISRAVKYLNDIHGISHTDIKKDNIRGVKENGTIKYKLIDFDTGISIDEDDFVDFNRGTNAYTTPESIFDNKLCRKSDVWQIGMTMYFLLKRNENMNMLIYDPKQAEARYMSKLRKNYAGSEIEDVLDFILVWCPERRPTIDQVIHCLQEKLKVIKAEKTEE